MPRSGRVAPPAAERPVGHTAVLSTPYYPVRPFRPSLRRRRDSALSADSSAGSSAHYSALRPFPWHATALGPAEASRGKRSSRPCIDAGSIQRAPPVDGGLRGCAPARPERTTPCSRCLSLAPPGRSPLPSAPLEGTPVRCLCPAAPRIPGQGTCTPEHDRMHRTHTLPPCAAPRRAPALALAPGPGLTPHPTALQSPRRCTRGAGPHGRYAGHIPQSCGHRSSAD